MATKKTTTKAATAKTTKKAPAKQAQTKKAPAKNESSEQAPVKPAKPKDKKLSALDAAAKVLAESPEPLTAKQMIEAMAAKGYWTSPGGKTPHATLYSAILREIKTKGEEARFTKTERGKFTANV